MLSNSVVSLAPGEARDALLLTAKARVIAPLRVLRRGSEDFLLLTEPELGEVVRSELLRSRFAARAEIDASHTWTAVGLSLSSALIVMFPARMVMVFMRVS